MNRRVWIGIVSLGWVVLLAGCAQTPTPAATPVATAIPAIPLQSAADGPVRASGFVVPAHHAGLGFTTAGRVASVDVAVGQQVEAGTPLVTLDTAAAEAALVQAQAARARAEAQLEALRAGARPQEVDAGQARLDAAQARLTQLTEGARPEEIAAARAALAAAQAAQQRLFSGPGDDEKIAAEAARANAEAALQQAQAAYDRVAGNPDIGARPESRQLQEATNNYAAARARYDALFAAPNTAAVAAARAQVQQAQATLDKLLSKATAGQIAEATAQVHTAQAELDLLTAGTRAQDVAAAEAAVTDATAALALAESNLANLTLRAPFTGTLTDLRIGTGEMVLPGAAVLTLADLSQLQVETTDLSERDVARVTVGQPVKVMVTPLDTEIAGRVLRIAPQANIVAGDVVYTVIVALDELPTDLRWGMSAEIETVAR